MAIKIQVTVDPGTSYSFIQKQGDDQRDHHQAGEKGQRKYCGISQRIQEIRVRKHSYIIIQSPQTPVWGQKQSYTG